MTRPSWSALLVAGLLLSGALAPAALAQRLPELTPDAPVSEAPGRIDPTPEPDTGPAIERPTEPSGPADDPKRPVEEEPVPEPDAEPKKGDDVPKEGESAKPDEEASALNGGGDMVRAEPDVKGVAGIRLDRPTVSSNTGALSFSYPIPLPAGRGTTPELSFSYNSQDERDAGLGAGWSVSIPFIERLAKHGSQSLYTENNFTSSLSGELTATGAGTYAAKRERGEFLEYAFADNAWTVRDKTGLTYVFGKTADSRLDDAASSTRAFRWMLSETVDADGNVVRYTYAKDPFGRQLYPQSIAYPIWRDPVTGTETVPVFEVSFNWNERSNYYIGQRLAAPVFTYKPGFRVQTNRLLGGVHVYMGGSVSMPPAREGNAANDLKPDGNRRYVFAYNIGENQGRLLLTSITPGWDSNSDSQLVSRPTTFEYSKQEAANRTWSETAWQFPSATGTDAVRFPEGVPSGGTGSYGNSRFADVDGDGLIDLLSGTKGYRNTGTGFVEVAAWALPSLPYPVHPSCPTGSFQMDFGETVFRSGSHPIQIAELNGDGRADLVLINALVRCEFHEIEGATGIFFGGPDGWTPAPSWTIPQATPEANFRIRFNDEGVNDWGYRMGDINNDGLSDIFQSRISTNADEFRLFLNTGSGWASSTGFQFPTVIWCDGYHGDVLKPLAFFDSSWRTKVPLSLLDMNNDGLNDLVLDGPYCTNPNYSEAVADTIFYGTGTGWESGDAFPRPNNARSNDDPGMRLAGDVNGDGLSQDVMHSRTQVEQDKENVSENQGVWPVGNWIYAGYYHGTLPQWTYPERPGCDAVDPSTHRVGFAAHLPRSHQDSNPGIVPMATQVVDLDGDGLTDLVAVGALQPCRVIYYGGDYGSGPGLYYYRYGWQRFPGDTLPRETKFWRNQGIRADLLTKVTFPHGGTTSVSYAMSATMTDETGRRINGTSPINLPVVTKISSMAGLGQPAVTTEYSYAGGHYRVGAFDDREFAGFRRVIQKDAVGATTATWYHQGDGNDAASLEAGDAAAAVALPYRVERRDAAGSLRALDVTLYRHAAAPSLADGRFFTTAATSTSQVLEADGTSAWTARTADYDLTNGNLLSAKDYGDVAGSANGTFTDSGSDGVAVTSYAYAAPQPGFPRSVGFVSEKAVTDASANLLSRERYRYDGLAQGLVGKGKRTATSRLIGSVSGTDVLSGTSATYAANGLLSTSTDELGTVTTYAYDSRQLYPSSSTRTLGATPFETKHWYQWTLGLKVGETLPGGFSTYTDVDGYGRPLRTSVHATGEPKMRVKESWTYDDAAGQPYGGFGATMTHRLHALDLAGSPLDARRDAVETVHSDGLDREVRRVTLLPDPAGGEVNAPSIVDTAHDARGLAKKSSLAFFGAPDAVTAPWRPGSVPSPTAANRWIVKEHDALGRVTSVTDALGVTAAAHSARALTVTDALGRPKKLSYDARGRLAGVEERNRESGVWQSYVTSYSYDLLGNLTGLTDADGNVRAFAYDKLGRRTSAHDLHALGDATFGVWNYAYDAAGNPTLETNPDGGTVTRTYDAFGRLKTQQVGSLTWTLTYDSCYNGTGLLCLESSASGTISHVYDQRRRPATRTETAAGRTFMTSFTYDLQGRETILTLPDGSVISRDHRAGKPVIAWMQEPGGLAAPFISSIAYAADGRMATVTYANGAVTTDIFDANALDRLIRRKTVAPASGPDNRGFHTLPGDGLVDRFGTSWSAIHDASVGTSVNTAGTDAFVRIGNDYGTLRLSRAFLPFDTSAIPDDAIITAVRLKVYVTGISDAVNDGNDWVTVVTATQPSVTALTTSDFTRAGAITNPVELLEPAQRKDLSNVSNNQWLTFTLNASSTALVSKTGPTKLALRLGHDVLNVPFTGEFLQSNTLIFSAGERSGTDFDPSLEVEWMPPSGTHGATVVQDVSYAYDAVGNLLGVTESASGPAARSVAYAYDDLDRLLSATAVGPGSAPLYAQAYTYGRTGNRLTASAAVGTSTPIVSTYAHEGHLGSSYANPHAATSVTAGGSAKGLGYRRGGQLASFGADTYAHDAAGSMLSAVEGGVTTSFTYDRAGRRLATVTGTLKTHTPSAEYTAVGPASGLTSRERRIFAEGRLLGTFLGHGSTSATSTPHLVHADHLGGASVLTDWYGNTLEAIDYLPYGEIRVDQKSGAYSERRKYAGHEYDASTGLSYQKARYYDPALGKFLSQDPVFWEVGQTEEGKAILLNPQAANSYSYAGNSPIVNRDPDGRFWWKEFYTDWEGYVGLKGVGMKLGEVLGGRFAAQDAIAANAANIAKSSAQTGVSADVYRAIMYEENAHQMPPAGLERVVENLSPGSVKGGIGVMQVSSKTSGLSNGALLDDATNVSAGGAILQGIQSRHGTDVVKVGAVYNSGGITNVHGQAYGQRIAAYTNASLSPTMGDKIVRSITGSVARQIPGPLTWAAGSIKNAIKSLGK